MTDNSSPKDPEFLPAAESLVETPVSPLSRVLAFTIALLFLVGLAWAMWAEVDTVVTAQGRLVAEDRSKLVQSEFGGTVKAILVRNGDRVTKGQRLIEFDDTLAETERRSTLVRLQAQQADVATLTALLTDQDPAFAGRLPSTVVRDAEAKFEAQRLEHLAAIAKFQADYARQASGLHTIDARLQIYGERLVPARDKRRRASLLHQDRLLSQLEFDAIEDEVREFENQITVLTAQRLELENQLAATIRDHEVYLTTRASQLAQRHSELATSIQELEQRLLRLERDRAVTVVTAPETGIVQELTAFTIGGIIAPGDVIMRIAPSQYDLEGEALVLNKDVGFVHQGMPVKIKLEAFPFTKYGFLEGAIQSISLDTIEDPTFGLVYGTTITFDQRTIVVEGQDVPLTPGMTATFEVQTGQQRVIEFLISPLLRFQDEALRER